MPISDNPFRLSVDLNADAASVIVKVIERESGDVVEEDTFDARAIADTVKTNVALYGLSKLLQDRSSEVSAGPEKLASMKEVYDMLKAGQWERERKAGAPVVSSEVEALATLKKITVAQAQAALRKYTKEQREKILSNPAIVAKAAEIKAARGTTEVNLDDLA